MLLVLPLFFAAVATYFATESWRWLLSKHRPDRARQIYTTLNAQSSSSAINTEFDAVQAHVRATQFSGGVAMCTKSRSKSGTPSLQPWHRIFLACLLQIAASLSGLSTIITSVGSLSYDFSGPDHYTVADHFYAALPTIQLAFSFLPLAFVDSTRLRLLAGRRNLLIVSFLGMAFCFFIPVILFAAADLPNGRHALFDNSTENGSRSYQAACFAFLIIGLMFYSLGAGFIPWLYMAEVAASPSATTRTASVCITVAVNYAVGIMMNWVLLYGFIDLGWKFWVVWLVLDVFWAVVVFLVVPETTGKSLEEIDERFVEGVRWFVTVRDRRIESGKRGANVSAATGEGFESVEMDDDIRRRGVSPDAGETNDLEVHATREQACK